VENAEPYSAHERKRLHELVTWRSSVKHVRPGNEFKPDCTYRTTSEASTGNQVPQPAISTSPYIISAFLPASVFASLQLLTISIAKFHCLGGWFGAVTTPLVTSSPVSTGIGDDLWRVYNTIPIVSRPLSLAIPPRVYAMSIGDGCGHRWRRNDEFCVAVGPAIRTAHTLAEVV